MSINYIIIDDEPIAHRIIEGYANHLSQLKKIGNCYNAFEAIQLIQKEQISLLFLDINMPKLSGFEFLKTIPNPPQVIVTSAYKEFALEGYELDVVDYLLKPFSFERFLKAIHKISFTNKDDSIAIVSNTKNEHLFIKGDKKLHQIFLNDILYIEAYGNYSKVNLDNEIIITPQKISEFETLLSSDFIRVHKSFIVSKPKIKAIQGNIIYINDQKIPVGQTYKSIVKTIYQ